MIFLLTSVTVLSISIDVNNAINTEKEADYPNVLIDNLLFCLHLILFHWFLNYSNSTVQEKTPATAFCYGVKTRKNTTQRNATKAVTLSNPRCISVKIDDSSMKKNCFYFFKTKLNTYSFMIEKPKEN